MVVVMVEDNQPYTNYYGLGHNRRGGGGVGVGGGGGGGGGSGGGGRGNDGDFYVLENPFEAIQ